MWSGNVYSGVAAGLIEHYSGLIKAHGYWAGVKKRALPYTRLYTVPSAWLGREVVLKKMVAGHGPHDGRPF